MPSTGQAGSYPAQGRQDHTQHRAGRIIPSTGQVGRQETQHGQAGRRPSTGQADRRPTTHQSLEVTKTSSLLHTLASPKAPEKARPI